MIIAAYLGIAGLTDVGYRFFSVAEAALATRVTAGVVDAGDGWYSAQPTVPSGTASVRWDSTGTLDAKAREYVDDLSDPMAKLVPNGYAVGTAGRIIGDNLDAKVSTRSVYAGADTPGTGTLLSRIASALTIIGGKVEVNDKTGFSLVPAYDLAKTAAQPGAAMTLTSVYDAAKSAASQASVNAIKIVVDKLDTALEIDGVVYRFTTNALENAPTGGGGGGTTDWSIGEREQIRHRLGLDGATAAPAAVPSLASQVSLNGVKVVTDKLDTALELDGSVYRFTTNALEQAPVSGAGGTTDWTNTEREQIRHRLGIDGVANAPAAASSLASQSSVNVVNGKVDTIGTDVILVKNKTNALPSDPADASDIAQSFFIVNQKLDVIDDFVDLEVPAIKAVTDKLNTTIELDGAVYRFTLNALELAPSGSGTITINKQDVRDAMLLAPTPPAVPASGSIDAKLDGLVASSGTGAFAITTQVVDDEFVGIQNAAVRVTSGAITFIGTTDEFGMISFSLDSASYMVSVVAFGFQFVPEMRTVTGNQTGTLVNLLVMTPTAMVPPPADASMCRVTGYFETLDNLPAKDVEVVFTLIDVVPPGSLVKSEQFIAHKIVRVKTNMSGQLSNDGYEYVDLVRNDQITPSGTHYRVECSAIELDQVINLITPMFDLLTLG